MPSEINERPDHEIWLELAEEMEREYEVPGRRGLCFALRVYLNRGTISAHQMFRMRLQISAKYYALIDASELGYAWSIGYTSPRIEACRALAADLTAAKEA